MSRKIYLPELVSINIKNYTLYPNGLDYTYDFVKGVNLILGGNGMGKTTFVNIIRFGLIGLYKKAKDLTRTYKERAIVKRLLYPTDYFSARADESIQRNGDAVVILRFRIDHANFEVTRSLENGRLLSVLIDGIPIVGQIFSEEVFERLGEKEQKSALLYGYEQKIHQYSNLTFDDLIFFVNEILFFGESHTTVLWNEGIDGRTDVQNELFNKYFNEPELDAKRQDMQRKARYYDSLSRHRSEDMRVITSLIKKIRANQNPQEISSPTINIVSLRAKIEVLTEELSLIQGRQEGLHADISILQGEINRSSIKASQLDGEKKRIEKEMNASIWETLHPQYDVFVKNIQMNHLCPMCSHETEGLVTQINTLSDRCFLCGNEIRMTKNEDLIAKYKAVAAEHKDIYQSITGKQRKIKAIEDAQHQLDQEFREKDLQRRTLMQQLREMEFQRASSSEADKLQSLDDEYNRLEKEKANYQQMSAECDAQARELTRKIEDEILSNVARFSAIFASYAEKFLKVPCKLEYTNYDKNEPNRFYPIVDGKVRRQEESLSESQRFFIDHSFRMSILTFFYQSPSFYIVETPDSSLDLSYEQNAAGVFLQFLKKPNIVIVTSNLNNSSFVDYLTNDQNVKISMVGLLDIAKKTEIQESNQRISSIYNEIKSRIQ